jgi:hypothetical protein
LNYSHINPTEVSKLIVPQVVMDVGTWQNLINLYMD